jgi:hypothetical protein
MRAPRSTPACCTSTRRFSMRSPPPPATSRSAPAEIQSILTSGLQDVSNSLIDDAISINDILRMILEAMYSGMGFAHVVLCIKDGRHNTMCGKFGFGDGVQALVKAFDFSLAGQPDVFLVALQNNADILITDIDDPKIATRIPAWYRQHVPARTFVLFPIIVKGKPIGLIYADRPQPGDITIPEKNCPCSSRCATRPCSQSGSRFDYSEVDADQELTMKRVCALALSVLVFGGVAHADDVTYRKDIRPLWERQCMACHGDASPSAGEFDEDKDGYKARLRGPRMNDYANLAAFVGWPDSGALMRRLDDGTHTPDGKPGNMYEYLGADAPERQKNLALFKAWVGEGGWVLKRFKELTREELGRMKVRE